MRAGKNRMGTVPRLHPTVDVGSARDNLPGVGWLGVRHGNVRLIFGSPNFSSAHA